MTMQTLDSPQRYGAVSRLLHWGMAAILAWQFTGMVLLNTLGKVPITFFFIGSHSSLGLSLALLAFLRLLWWAKNAGQRPSQEATLNGRLASLGHLGLYALLIVVPLNGLLIAYGSGKALAWFGLPLWAETGEKVVWMLDLGKALHGVLAWTLLAMIVGHASMAIWHRVALRDKVWSRMV